MNVGDKVRITKDTYWHSPAGSSGVIIYKFPTEPFGRGEANRLYRVKRGPVVTLFRGYELEAVEIE